jgi:hypothetical protein
MGVKKRHNDRRAEGEDKRIARYLKISLANLGSSKEARLSARIKYVLEAAACPAGWITSIPCPGSSIPLGLCGRS